MTLRPVPDLECQCPNTRDLLHAALHEQELEPCPVHHPDTSEADDAQRAAALVELAQTDPLTADVVRRIGAPVPLNAPLTDHPSLAGFTPDDAA